VSKEDDMPRGVYDRAKAKPRAKNGADSDAELMRGDPAQHVLGKPEEQSARIHADLPPVERRISQKSILADIKWRRQELEPVLAEVAQLEAALRALEGI
jgi:hypothetical protein